MLGACRTHLVAFLAFSARYSSSIIVYQVYILRCNRDGVPWFSRLREVSGEQDLGIKLQYCNNQTLHLGSTTATTSLRRGITPTISTSYSWVCTVLSAHNLCEGLRYICMSCFCLRATGAPEQAKRHHRSTSVNPIWISSQLGNHRWWVCSVVWILAASIALVDLITFDI